MAEYLTKNIVYTIAGDFVKILVNDHEEDEGQAKELAENVFENITGVETKLKVTASRNTKPKTTKKSTLSKTKSGDSWLPFPGNPKFQYNNVIKLGTAHPVMDIETKKIIGKANDKDFFELTEADKKKCAILSLNC